VEKFAGSLAPAFEALEALSTVHLGDPNENDYTGIRVIALAGLAAARPTEERCPTCGGSSRDGGWIVEADSGQAGPPANPCDDPWHNLYTRPTEEASCG